MKTVNKILLTAALALMPLANVWAAGWGPPTAPEGALTDFEAIVMSVTNWLLGFISLVAVLAIIYGGIQYVTAAGSSDRIRNAKTTITWAIGGLVIAGAAYAIVNVIVTRILAGSGGGGTTGGVM